MTNRSILILVALALVVLILVGLSLILAAAEGSVTRVTRSSLNNLILGLQTDQDLSQFSRMKRIDRIHKAQKLISQRQATSSGCAYFRIICDILIGLLVGGMTQVAGFPVWEQVVCGLVAAVLVAMISVTIGPRRNGAKQPLEILLRYVRIISIAVRLAPLRRGA